MCDYALLRNAHLRNEKKECKMKKYKRMLVVPDDFSDVDEIGCDKIRREGTGRALKLVYFYLLEKF
jgi:hypothetical protein